MQIVIDISEDDLDAIKFLKVKGWASRHELLILNGTPLPKGHGRLIDADELFLDIQTDEEMRLGEHLKWVRDRFDNAPTIIEADKESEEV